MRLTRQSNYAIRTLVYCAVNEPGLSRVAEIARAYGISELFLFKLIKPLVEAGLLQTVRGRHGGIKLGKPAAALLKELGHGNLTARIGDGMRGWPEQAPFDRILVTAALPEAPAELLGQLKPKGIMVGPQGKGSTQRLLRYTKSAEGDYDIEDLGEVRFVPLIAGVAKES